MKIIQRSVISFMVLALLTACGTPATQTAQTTPDQGTPGGAESKPAVGGTFIFAIGGDPTTLDFQNQFEYGTLIGQYIGAALVAKDPQTNELAPWLATEWKVSDDGLTWEFKLRGDVKFHDGTPFTAADMAWTLNRAIDPEKTTYVASLLDGMASAEAVDDTTLRINMAYPNYGLLSGLSNINLQPMSQAYAENAGDDLARRPMGVGPYKFKEWKTSEKIVLERNPEYTWGPAWSNGQPPLIENIEFRIIPEYSTRVAGLEAGEIDYTDLQLTDLDTLSNDANIVIYKYPIAGINGIFMNLDREPFTDLRVRQAFNYAFNRDDFIKIVGEGRGEPMLGPLSSNTVGYWPNTGQNGYQFDLEKAKALMAEAGWADADGDGILDKDGKPLVVELLSNTEYYGKQAVVLQDQMKALGVQISVNSIEDSGLFLTEMDAGNYTMVPSGFGWADNQVLFFMFHSSMIDYLNTGRVNDPELDKLLESMSQAVTEEDNFAAGYAAQKRIIEQAYMIPTFAPEYYVASNKRVQGLIFAANGTLWLDTAYIEVK